MTTDPAVRHELALFLTRFSQAAILATLCTWHAVGWARRAIGGRPKYWRWWWRGAR